MTAITARDGTHLVAMVITAEGYHSGSEACAMAIMTGDFYDANIDEVNDFDYTFHELDGKHSETEADCGTIHSLQGIKEYIVRTTADSDIFWESIQTSQEDYDIQSKYEKEFFEDFTSTTKVVYTYRGEEI